MTMLIYIVIVRLFLCSHTLNCESDVKTLVNVVCEYMNRKHDLPNLLKSSSGMEGAIFVYL